jgi:hypothetical protein
MSIHAIYIGCFATGNSGGNFDLKKINRTLVLFPTVAELWTFRCGNNKCLLKYTSIDGSIDDSSGWKVLYYYLLSAASCRFNG